VRTFRQEFLDHVIVLNERHLLALLTEFVRTTTTIVPTARLSWGRRSRVTNVGRCRRQSTDLRRTSSHLWEGGMRYPLLPSYSITRNSKELFAGIDIDDLATTRTVLVQITQRARTLIKR